MFSSINKIWQYNQFSLFILLCALQLLLISFLIFQYESVLEKGKPVIIKAEFYDPYDPFRGRYVSLSPQRIEIAEEQRYLSNTFRFLTAETNAQNKLNNVQLFKQKPQDKYYLELPVKNHWQMRWPFSRYYMQENLARKADNQIVQKIRNGNVQIQFRMYKGVGVIEKVFIGSQTLEDFIKQNLP